MVGHSQERQDLGDDEEVELGAIGGAPAPPPARQQQQQQPPPLPGGHPSSVARATSEPAAPSLNNLSRPPLPAYLPPPLRKAHSTATSTPQPRTPSPSSSCSSSRPPPLPTSPIPPLPAPNIASGLLPPPLPPGRHSVGRPPALPPGRPGSAPMGNQQEKSLPPEPPGQGGSDAESRAAQQPNPPVAAADGGAATRGESDDSDTDYSADFVSGAFWEINRKTPVPTARRAVLPPKPSSGSGGAAAAKTTDGSRPSAGDGGTDASGAMNLEELDEGYSDLAMVRSLRKPDTTAADPSTGKVDHYLTSKSDQYAKVMKKSASPGVSNPWGGDGWEVGRGGQENGRTEPAGDAGPVLEVTESGGDQRPSSVRSEGANGTTGSEGRPSPCQPPENYYAPFPVQSDGPANHAVVGGGGEEEVGGDGGDSTLLLKPLTAPGQQATSSAALPTDDLEQDSMYACAADASSLPANSVPPLPRRQDSLPSWKGDSSSSDAPSNNSGVVVVAAAASNGSSVPGASKAEGVVARPIPARRRTVHPISSPSPLVVSCHRNPSKSSPVAAKGSVSSMYIPPLPPRRGLVTGHSQSVDSAAAGEPPPLPARKAQSFRSHRPATSPPLSAGEAVGDRTPDSPGAGEESDPISERPSASVIRHQVCTELRSKVFIMHATCSGKRVARCM